jgi:hypothetical protein
MTIQKETVKTFGLDKDIKAELDENHFVSLVKDFMGNTQSDVGDW